MSDADNAHDRETDEWIVPADLRRPPTASVSGPESDADHGFTEALRLTRDGGEAFLRCGRGSCCDFDGHEGKCTR